MYISNFQVPGNLSDTGNTRKNYRYCTFMVQQNREYHANQHISIPEIQDIRIDICRRKTADTKVFSRFWNKVNNFKENSMVKRMPKLNTFLLIEKRKEWEESHILDHSVDTASCLVCLEENDQQELQRVSQESSNRGLALTPASNQIGRVKMLEDNIYNHRATLPLQLHIDFFF